MAQFIFPPLSASLDSEQVSGGSLPSKQMIVGGYHAGGTKVYPLAVDADGQLQVDVGAITPGTGATSLGKAIQSAQGTTDTGVAALVVRNDTLADLSGADGDYSPLQVNATGALYTTVSTGSIDVTSVIPGVGATNLGKAIQSAQGTTDTGVPALVVRNDTLADLSGADHDYAPLQVNATGALYTSLTAGTATIGNVDVNALAPVDFLDAGVLNSGTTNITTGGIVVCTGLVAAATELEVIDDIGEYMSLYTEPGGSTPGYTFKTYLPLGGGRVKASFNNGDKVKLYSEIGTTISSGKIAINFLG